MRSRTRRARSAARNALAAERNAQQRAARAGPRQALAGQLRAAYLIGRAGAAEAAAQPARIPMLRAAHVRLLRLFRPRARRADQRHRGARAAASTSSTRELAQQQTRARGAEEQQQRPAAAARARAQRPQQGAGEPRVRSAHAARRASRKPEDPAGRARETAARDCSRALKRVPPPGTTTPSGGCAASSPGRSAGTSWRAFGDVARRRRALGRRGGRHRARRAGEGGVAGRVIYADWLPGLGTARDRRPRRRLPEPLWPQRAALQGGR